MFARTDRSHRLGVTGIDERQDVGRGQPRPLARRPGAVRNGEHQPRPVGGAVAGHEQLRSELPNKTKGWDDVTLWEAPEPVTLPEEWWELVDRAEHVLLCGPAADGSHAALEAAAGAGELAAVIGRVKFL